MIVMQNIAVYNVWFITLGNERENVILFDTLQWCRDLIKINRTTVWKLQLFLRKVIIMNHKLFCF